eukprot:tig00021247_g19661.t1
MKKLVSFYQSCCAVLRLSDTISQHYLNILLGHWRHFTICGHRHCWTPSTRSTTQRFALMKSAPRIRLPSLMFRSIIPKHLTGDPSAVANEAVKVLLILDSNPYFLTTFSETMENAAPVSTNAMMDSAASLTRTVTLACTPRRRWTLRMAAAVSLSRSSLDGLLQLGRGCAPPALDTLFGT